MKRWFVFLFSLSCLITMGCTKKIMSESTNTAPNEIGYGQTSQSGQAIAQPENTMTFTDHLRKVSGVSVSGSGPNARITIRGVAASINSNTEPLFVIDGMQVSGGFSEVYQMVNINEVKSISVLKDPADTSIYGVRGANGVIVVKMK